MSRVITDKAALEAGKLAFASALAAARYVSLTGSATYEGGKYLPLGKPLLVGVEISERLADARVAAKTAEECASDQAAEDPLDRFQEECFELADQLASTASRVALLAGLFAALDDEGRDKAADLLASAYAPPAEFETPEVMALMAHVADRRRDLLTRTEDGRIAAAFEDAVDGASAAVWGAMHVAISGAEAPATGPDDAPLSSDQAAGAASTNTPPTEAGPSGDAAEASASAADPAAPAPAQPAAKPEGGSAKAKKPGG